MSIREIGGLRNILKRHRRRWYAESEVRTISNLQYGIKESCTENRKGGESHEVFFYMCGTLQLRNQG
jgi:hypothetical protein